jgi:hypothetical protein
MNLILGILWLAGGVGVLLYESFVEPLPFRLLGTVSIGWFMLVLSAWNFVRLYMIAMASADRQTQRLVDEARSRQRRRERVEREPDPTFDFSSPANDPPAHDAPPSKKD